MEGKKILVIQAKKYSGESSVVSARLPIEVVSQIDEIAKKSGKTRNEIMLACMEFALENIVVKDDKEDK